MALTASEAGKVRYRSSLASVALVTEQVYASISIRPSLSSTSDCPCNAATVAIHSSFCPVTARCSSKHTLRYAKLCLADCNHIDLSFPAFSLKVLCSHTTHATANCLCPCRTCPSFALWYARLHHNSALAAVMFAFALLVNSFACSLLCLSLSASESWPRPSCFWQSSSPSLHALLPCCSLNVS